MRLRATDLELTQLLPSILYTITTVICPPVRPLPHCGRLLLLRRRRDPPLPNLVLEGLQLDLGDVELVPGPPQVRVAGRVLAERALPQQLPRLVHRPAERERLSHALMTVID